MSLSDWLSFSGLSALAKIGWPEWTNKHGINFKMFRGGFGFCYDHDCRTGAYMHLDDHAALCIIRDWAREALQKGRASIIIESCKGLTVVSELKLWKYAELSRGDNYDAALIAAINHKERN